MPTNPWGPFTPQDDLYVSGPFSPPPTGDIVVPQSPAGTSTTNTDRNESATETLVSELVQNAQQGAPALNAPTPYSGVPAAAQGYYRWE